MTTNQTTRARTGSQTATSPTGADRGLDMTTELLSYQLPVDCPRCGQRLSGLFVPLTPSGRADRAWRYYVCDRRGCGLRVAVKIDPTDGYRARVSVRRCDEPVQP